MMLWISYWLWKSILKISMSKIWALDIDSANFNKVTNFNAVVGWIEINLLLMILWKQHHIFYVKIVKNILWHARNSTLKGGGAWVLIKDISNKAVECVKSCKKLQWYQGSKKRPYLPFNRNNVHFTFLLQYFLIIFQSKCLKLSFNIRNSHCIKKVSLFQKKI